jgi:hypothetical protein
VTSHEDDTTTGPVDAAQLRGIAGPAPLDAGAVQLVDALRQLSTLLLLTAEAADNILAALTGEPPDTDPHDDPRGADSEPAWCGHRADTRTGSERPKLAVVRPVTDGTPTGRAASPLDRRTDGRAQVSGPIGHASAAVQGESTTPGSNGLEAS